MNNFQFQMTSIGDERLVNALLLVWSAAGRKGATHYAIREATSATEFTPARPKRLVFFWCGKDNESTDKVAFPFTMDAKGAADFAARWLKETEYGCEPGYDGDNERGWKVYNERYGRVDDDRNSIIAVAPVWAMYGK